jgi:hypothetical protein
MIKNFWFCAYCVNTFEAELLTENINYTKYYFCLEFTQTFVRLVRTQLMKKVIFHDTISIE